VTVDEMNLISELRDVTPLRPEAYERARAELRGAMAGSEPSAAPVTGLATGRNRRRGTLGKVGIGAGIGAVAAGVAAVLAATSTAPPSAPTGSASHTPAVASPLMSLAAHITADNGPLPGNASLIIRTQVDGNIPPEVSYNLYVDSGAFYGGGDKKSLMQAVAQHQNMADGINAREVAAARYAVTGSLATARVRMINASPNWLGLGLSPAARKKLWAKAMAGERAIYKEKHVKGSPPPFTAQRAREGADNYLWNNSVDALSAGAGNPQVRAGVLRLLSTISAVTVTPSTTAGQPTLTLTAGPEAFGGSGEQILTINARTGMPIKSVVPANGSLPRSVDTFRVYRVTMANIRVGRF